ncbi:MAG: YigZ family protein, partial [Clostridia bacterium]
MTEYVTIESFDEPTQYETVINKSRFISSVIYVENKEQATAFVTQIRKKYFDATHNCYAYICDGAVKYSDDGEPQGTAGLPILDNIKAKNLHNVCVVVTRYFGGVKLGKGGLTRAYGGGASSVLAQCKIVECRECSRITASVSYSFCKVVTLCVGEYGVIDNTEYFEKVIFTITTPINNLNKLKVALKDATNGQITFGEESIVLKKFLKEVNKVE